MHRPSCRFWLLEDRNNAKLVFNLAWKKKNIVSCALLNTQINSVKIQIVITSNSHDTTVDGFTEIVPERSNLMFQISCFPYLHDLIKN